MMSGGLENKKSRWIHFHLDEHQGKEIKNYLKIPRGVVIGEDIRQGEPRHNHNARGRNDPVPT